MTTTTTLIPGSAEDLLTDALEKTAPNHQERWNASERICVQIGDLAAKVGFRVIRHSSERVEIAFGSAHLPRHRVFVAGDEEGVHCWKGHGVDPKLKRVLQGIS